MSGSRWTVAITDALSGRIWGVLPCESISQTQALNLPGELKVATPSQVDGDVTLREMQPWATLLVLMRGGVPIGPSAFLLSPTIDVAGGSVEWSCLGFGAYWRRRALLHDRQYLGADQAYIVRHLVSYAWATSGAGSGPATLRISLTGAPDTGVIRDRTYEAYQSTMIGELIENLAACQNGFNFRWQASKVTQFDGTLAFRNDLILSPQHGQPTTFVFVAGGNCDIEQVPIDGSMLATHVTAIGAGELGEAPTLTVVNPPTNAPRLDEVLSLSDVSIMDTLTEHAQARAHLGARSIVRPQLRIHPDADPGVGEYQVGDLCRIRGRFGLANIDDDYVITEKTLTLSQGEESVLVTAVPAETLSGGEET